VRQPGRSGAACHGWGASSCVWSCSCHATPNRLRLLFELLGLLNPGISYALSLVGLPYATASLSALLWAVEPLLIVGLAWLVLHERQTAGFLILSAFALVVFCWRSALR
jgi:drug/metabolite transporter (DMT)-like permease